MSILRDNVNEGPGGLRKLIKRGQVVAPGVFDGISALLAQKAGFKALYLSGSGIAGKSGLPDLGVTTLGEVAEDVRHIVSVSKLPVIVDADTGFGEALNVIRAVRELEAAGAAAIHVEDQEMPKKCGHLLGKRIVPIEEMERKIRAAVSARRNDEFLIIARTDARSAEGIEGAIERAKAYAEAGADAIFPEALESRDEFALFAKKVRKPLMANMTEFGKSPLLSADELERIGYRIVIFPLTAFRASMLAMELAYGQLYRDGTQKRFIDRLMTREGFYGLIGYHAYEKEDMEIHDDKL